MTKSIVSPIVEILEYRIMTVEPGLMPFCSGIFQLALYQDVLARVLNYNKL